MITVDCSSAKPIKDKLLVFVADRLGVLPILKSDKFVLTSLDDSKMVEKPAVLVALKVQHQSDFTKLKWIHTSLHYCS